MDWRHKKVYAYLFIFSFYPCRKNDLKYLCPKKLNIFRFCFWIPESSRNINDNSQNIFNKKIWHNDWQKHYIQVAERIPRIMMIFQCLLLFEKLSNNGKKIWQKMKYSLVQNAFKPFLYIAMGIWNPGITTGSSLADRKCDNWKWVASCNSIGNRRCKQFSLKIV